AELRPGALGQRFAARAYPWPAVDAATVAATEALLANDGLDAGIHRAVQDAGDDLRRALASRQRFPTPS
ncbi:MAG TPA: hypothetical protein VFU35_04400, partial [Jatrophihabitans sp.]|nr:hypothetical protein [Jatrophihabitans sp.]